MDEKLIMQTQERLDMAKIVFTPEQFRSIWQLPTCWRRLLLSRLVTSIALNAISARRSPCSTRITMLKMAALPDARTAKRKMHIRITKRMPPSVLGVSTMKLTRKRSARKAGSIIRSIRQNWQRSTQSTAIRLKAKR